MDEGSGTVAYDESGNGDNGTWNGSTTNGSYYSGGKVGSWAGTFDGTSTYVNAGATPALNFGTGNFSLVVWINTTQSPSIVGRIITKRAGGDTSWYSLFLTSSGNIQLETTGGNGNSSVTVNNGQWHQIVAVKNGTAISYYVDGSAAGSTTGAANLMTTDNLYFGGWGTVATGQDFLGKMDDIRIYNRALSAAEIQALYDAEK